MINAIKSVLASTTEQLLNLDHVESLIKEFGLYNDPRNIYGEPYNQWMLNDDDLPGTERGGMYQIPRQIASTAIWLHDKEIKSYLDVGTFYGYTFAFLTAYLSKFGLEKAIACDSNKYIKNIQDIIDVLPAVKEYHFREGPIERMGHPSITNWYPGFGSFDLVFIDGNHNYSAVKADWENVGQYAKYCAFHDINDEYCERECEGGGPVTFWRELKENIKKQYQQELIRELSKLVDENIAIIKIQDRYHELTYHPENKRVMGIGIIQPGRKAD